MSELLRSFPLNATSGTATGTGGQSPKLDADTSSGQTSLQPVVPHSIAPPRPATLSEDEQRALHFIDSAEAQMRAGNYTSAKNRWPRIASRPHLN
jgi:glutamate 5-kinase